MLNNFRVFPCLRKPRGRRRYVILGISMSTYAKESPMLNNFRVFPCLRKPRGRRRYVI